MALYLPTPEDFILAFGEVETIELTNLEAANVSEVFVPKLNNAISQAYDFVYGYEALAKPAGKQAIARAAKGLILTIARYHLDAIQRRDEVKDAYEKAIDFLNKCLVAEGSPDKDSPETNTVNGDIFHRGGRRAFTDKSLSDFRNQRLRF